LLNVSFETKADIFEVDFAPQQLPFEHGQKSWKSLYAF